MPLNKDAFTRYLLIDQRLNSKQLPPPSIVELTDYISDKIEKTVSKSTVQKDILSMRKDPNLGYEAPIIYDTSVKGYRYEYTYSINQLPMDENDLQGISMAISLLGKYQEIPDIANMNNLLMTLAQKVNIQKDHIDSMGAISYQNNKYIGIQYISRIIEAIKDKKILYIDYQRFNSDQVKTHTVHPYFLKEFENRLYLIGLDIHRSKDPLVLTFALDRCTDVITSYEYFRENIPDRDLYFKNLYGVSDVNKEAEDIVMKVENLQYKYLETNPLHGSQTAQKNEDHWEVHIHAVVNYELTAKILSLGNKVEVLSPQPLRQKIYELAASIAAQYK